MMPKQLQNTDLAYPMGARMMSGHTTMHEKFEEMAAVLLTKKMLIFLILDTREWCQ